jgi:hypothetical protein
LDEVPYCRRSGSAKGKQINTDYGKDIRPFRWENIKQFVKEVNQRGNNKA